MPPWRRARRRSSAAWSARARRRRHGHHHRRRREDRDLSRVAAHRGRLPHPRHRGAQGPRGGLRAQFGERDVILGNGADPLVLERAGILHADVVVAATGEDEVNLVVSTLAKMEYSVPRGGARQQPRQRLDVQRGHGRGRGHQPGRASRPLRPGGPRPCATCSRSCAWARTATPSCAWRCGPARA